MLPGAGLQRNAPGLRRDRGGHRGAVQLADRAGLYVSYDRYIDALEAVLHSSKEELSRLLEGAEESLSYREARGRGYEDVLGAAED